MTTRSPPASILIVGSGVFGLSTAYALAQHPSFAETKITILDRAPDGSAAPDASSVDASRIVRADYPHAAYARLAAQAQEKWRGEWGAEGRYTECGLAIFTGEDAQDQDDGREEAAEKGKGKTYAEGSMRNVVEGLGLKLGRREDGGQASLITDEQSAREVMGTAEGMIGTKGYVNWTSGWAHAAEGLNFLWRKVKQTDRVDMRHGEVKTLIFEDGKSGTRDVHGAELVNGEKIHADLTILATGAWSPKFIDLRGRASATGQVLTYLDITAEEEARLAKNPVFISFENGMFIIPPRGGQLKVARHGYGYSNPTSIPNPEKPSETIEVSLPWTVHSDSNLRIPEEGLKASREFLARCIPWLADRPFTHGRICWYTDTQKGDYIVDHHPSYPSLFVATGGSGHGYKFLPVLGERIVDVLTGEARDDLSEELRARWSWPTSRGLEDHVRTDDTRGGRRGMVLSEELARSD